MASHHPVLVRAPSLITLIATATTLGSLSVGVAPAGAARVLVVGDSLAVGTAPYLTRELGDVPVEIDAVVGRPSPSGVPVLAKRLRPDHEVVVFDLGTNDGPTQPGALAGSLARARQIVGDRCMVVATISRPPAGGVTVARQNEVVRSFAVTGNVQVVDWRAIAGSDPALIRGDGVHATPAGYALRAGLFAQAIGGCLSSSIAGIPAPQGDVQQPPRPPKPRPVPRRPGRVDWRALAARGPIELTAALVSNAWGVADAGLRTTRVAVGGAGPEPVLGAPEP